MSPGEGQGSRATFGIQLGSANNFVFFKHFGSSTCWKRILLGEVTSARNEQQALDTAAKICHFLIEETQHALLQISQLKRDKENLKTQLALVEMLRSEDLKILQKSAEILCSLNLGTT